ncbi:TAFII55 protein conserved region-domain-containing protein [Bisporella sp. PMI_857]|nr:TAFII55 protein conserved region-domain-containing protein [Bisporella sp. PMI_857]
MVSLKLNIGAARSTFSNTPSGSTPAAMGTPTAETPSGTKTKKIIFKTNSARSTPVPATPAPAVLAPAPVPVQVDKPKKTKAGRQPKDSAKKLESKKRKEESDTEGESTINVLPPTKKIKLNTKINPSTNTTPLSATTSALKTPLIRAIRSKGKQPHRAHGEGYDSEASDIEDDPVIEEQFILRMLPGDDCDYIQQAIINKRIGLPLQQGGADVRMKFFHKDGRRAAITIRGSIYAATLVDLPCIIEGMKSWDKRGWLKSADICQMLWVFAPIRDEKDAQTINLPKIIDPNTFQYPHGLTPPMHYARKRRFRKRISRTAIEAVEEAVEALLARDKEVLSKGGSVKYESIKPVVEASQDEDEYSGTEEEEEAGEEDAEADFDDVGYFNNNHHGNGHVADGDAELEADLEAAFEEQFTPMADTPASVVGDTPLANGQTQVAETGAEEDSGDESGEEGFDEDEEDGSDIDDEEKARQAQIEGTREDIADLERQIKEVEVKMNNQQNSILKKRMDDNLKKLRAELLLKQSSLGEDDY